MKSMKNGKGRKGNKGQKSRTARDQSATVLPAVNDQLCVGMRLRFITTSQFVGSISVSYTNLLDAWLVAGTATNGYQLFDFVKIKRVTVRAMGPPIPFISGVTFGNQSMCTVGIEFPGLVVGQSGGGKQMSESSLGSTRPAYVSLAPDSQSQAAQFQASSNANAFVVRAVDNASAAVQGCIIDVDLVYRNSGDVAPAALSSAIAGAIPGDLYFGGIDGGRLAATAARSAFIRRI